MEKVSFEKEILEYLNIPSIPKKEFDGKTSFEKGVAVIGLYHSREAYAVATFNADKDKKPRIIKVFNGEQFLEVKRIYVVPPYIVDKEEVEGMDLDDESKKKVEDILEEADEIENEGMNKAKEEAEKLPEWIFPHIENRDQAEAYVRSYRQSNGIKRGSIPTTDDALKNVLLSIYLSNKKRNQN